VPQPFFSKTCCAASVFSIRAVPQPFFSTRAVPQPFFFQYVLCRSRFFKMCCAAGVTKSWGSGTQDGRTVLQRRRKYVCSATSNLYYPRP
jgi:hypothetical protein